MNSALDFIQGEHRILSNFPLVEIRELLKFELETIESCAHPAIIYLLCAPFDIMQDVHQKWPEFSYFGSPLKWLNINIEGKTMACITCKLWGFSTYLNFHVSTF